MKKVLLFNVILLVSASTIQSKKPMMESTTRTIYHPGNAVPVTKINNEENDIPPTENFEMNPVHEPNMDAVPGKKMNNEYKNVHMNMPIAHEPTMHNLVPMKRIEDVSIDNLILLLSDKLEIEHEQAEKHVQMILNMLEKALQSDKELIQEIAMPMISSIGQKMFTDAPRYSTKTMVSLTTVRR